VPVSFYSQINSLPFGKKQHWRKPGAEGKSIRSGDFSFANRIFLAAEYRKGGAQEGTLPKMSVFAALVVVVCSF
jgi:hypothetical protein